MGWMWYAATHYKNGKVDRKAECDAYFMEGLNRGFYQVLKSSMVGKIYYAAVKPLKRCTDNGYEDIPEEKQEVFAAIFITAVDSRSNFDFGYKDMDETCGPFYNDCPKGILDLLSPTENENALAWRKACRENRKRNNQFSSMPDGSVLYAHFPWDTSYHRKGEVVRLVKQIPYGRKHARWCSARCIIPNKMMNHLAEENCLKTTQEEVVHDNS